MTTGELIFLCLIIAEVILAAVGFGFLGVGYKMDKAQFLFVGVAFILISLVCPGVGAILGKIIP